MIDNYDSFVFNLVQYLGQVGALPSVFRNDELSVDQIRDFRPDGILVSPGPGRPADAGVSLAVIRELGGDIPILGVCLGHQAIGEAFGGTIVRAPSVMHGKVSNVRHDGEGVFSGLPDGFVATRYHSLVIDPSSVPAELIVTASTDDGVIMGVRHRSLPIEGVQFHPEAVLTENGHRLVENFLASL